MKPLRAGRSTWIVVVGTAIGLAVGCSNAGDEKLSSSSTPIIGGVADSTNTWVVGIDVGGAGICSGSLIAPNLVLTARHCVSKTPAALDCDPDGGLATNKILGNYAASAFRVTTGQQVGASPQWTVRAVRYLEDPLANRLCGYDLALLELNKNAAGAFPTKWMPPSLTTPLRHKYVAAGYGCQNAEKYGGGGCDPRGYRMMLDPVTVVEVTPLEFFIVGRVCGGDSGGPVWNKVSGVIYGALSRGDGTTSTEEGCNYGLYTRIDAHLAWVQKYGKVAAANGGYATLPWMTATPPPPDAGPPPPPPPKKVGLGEACASADDCTSGVCVDFGEQLCSAPCDAVVPCPTGFACNGGYCFPESKMPDPEPSSDAGVTPAAEETIRSSTCAVGTDFPPPKPQPWIVAAFAGVAAVLVRRRR